MTMGDFTGGITKEGGFFQFQLRDAVYVVVVLAAGASFLFSRSASAVKHDDQMSSDMSSLTINVTQLTEVVKSIKQRQDDMDVKGTQYDQAQMRLQVEKNMEQDRRVLGVEDTVKTLVPDVREIKTQVNLMVNYFGDGATKPHK